jgi:hypothetical protein
MAFSQHWVAWKADAICFNCVYRVKELVNAINVDFKRV